MQLERHLPNEWPIYLMNELRDLCCAFWPMMM
jgi:hypothetical protein